MRRTCRFVAVFLMTAAACPPLVMAHESPADQAREVEALRRRVDELERVLRELQSGQQQRSAPHGVAPVAEEAPAAGAGTATDRAEPAAAPAVAAKTAAVVGYEDGFFLKSGDGDDELKLNGFVHADSRFFPGDDPENDQFFIRRARIDIRGKVAKRFSFRLTPDFAGSTLTLFDASLDVKFAPWLVLRLGKTKTPFGLERLQSSTDLVLIERSLVDNLVPNRDVGVMLHGEAGGGIAEYAAAVFNGTADGSSGDTNPNDGVDVVARLFLRPFRNMDVEALHGLGFGVAGTYGREQGSASSAQLGRHRTSSRVVFFRYASASDAPFFTAAIASGDRWRLSPQGHYYFGPFGLLGEYVVSSQEIAGAARATATNDAWQVQASYVLTGEDASYKGIEPENDFDFGDGGWGAWQIALRYAGLEADGDLVARGLAVGARTADTVTAGLNWHLNSNVALYLNYEHTEFRRPRGQEDVILSRAQFAF
ncbi:MAG TPA: porin [Candidatus Binatia bacterium]|nr:porin [Candidatus Binatia bacterium]